MRWFLEHVVNAAKPDIPNRHDYDRVAAYTVVRFRQLLLP
jgi:hypothetical protein